MPLKNYNANKKALLQRRRTCRRTDHIVLRWTSERRALCLESGKVRIVASLVTLLPAFEKYFKQVIQAPTLPIETPLLH